MTLHLYLVGGKGILLIESLSGPGTLPYINYCG